jgi:hypothetical protein
VFEATDGESVTDYADRVDPNRSGVHSVDPTPFARENS